MLDQFIYSTDDVLRMLDTLVMDRGGPWWSEFFADHVTSCPFLVDWPDENLVEWFDAGLLVPGRVLELGCGNGRAAAYLAGLGCRVDAVDFSAQAIDWAIARAASRWTSSAVPSLTRRSRPGATTWSTTRAASTICRRTAARTT